MKAAVEILQIHAATLLGLVAVVLLLGCAGKGRESTYSTTVKRDPQTGAVVEEVRTETHSSDLKATGYKLALEKIAAEERRGEGTSRGPGDYYYSIGADSADASPESQLLTGFQAAASLAAQFGGGRLISSPTDQQLSPDDLADVRALLSELRDARERLENKEEP